MAPSSLPTDLLPSVLQTASLERRRIWALFFGLPLIVGLLSVDQRAIMMPWADAEHPLNTTTPSAFFAQATPTGISRRGPSLASVSTPRRFFAAPEAGAPGGAGAPLPLPPTGDVGLPDLPTDPGAAGSPPPGAAGGGPTNGPGLPGSTPVGAPIGTSGAVPEASTWAMMIIGFAAIGRMLRRRKRQMAALSPA